MSVLHVNPGHPNLGDRIHHRIPVRLTVKLKHMGASCSDQAQERFALRSLLIYETNVETMVALQHQPLLGDR